MEWRGAFVGGEEIAQPPNAEVVEVQSPWDPKWIGRSFLAGRELVEDAVESSLRAFEVWRRSSPEERSSLLTRIADEIARRKERLAELLVSRSESPSCGPRARSRGSRSRFDSRRNWHRSSARRLSISATILAARTSPGPSNGSQGGQSWLSSLTTGLTISLRTSSRPRWPPATRSFSSPPPMRPFPRLNSFD
ncbi:MAG: aldehyde dehydrogenase family protein [Armatimonadetes bacterium]|nr:MAG: aldehyde dehydrogenase family protein [Armatimonadota bacterium]